MKQHRVGTITLGSMLITFGLLFLLRIFITSITFDIIFKLWPIIFIFLGIEILASNFKRKEEKMLYDGGAIALIIILSFFAMGMAMVDYCIQYAGAHITLY